MQLPIACRYVPYDQWFLTHIDPTWKIKHLKQRIISKCLNLPFDPRFKDGTRNGRSPSPITFAPANARPASPIRFVIPDHEAGSDHQESAGEGYEDDDEWDQVSDIKFNVKSKSSSFRPHRQQKQDQEPQITTHTYTLFRFSTCQILEEDCQVSWYDIQPHELVELHSSFLPPTFTSSLVSPLSIPSPPPDIVASTQTKFTQKKKASPITSTDQGDFPIPSLTALPRHTPKLYIQPYWQGWVRALRVVPRIQTTPASVESPHPSLEDNDREGNGDREQRERVEWRERWVVIHDGVINICKSPNDPNPTRIPLSSLTALRGPEYLPHSKNCASKLQSTTRSPEPSTAPTMTSEDLKEATESVPDKEKRTTRGLKKTRKDELLSTASSPSLRSLGQDRQPQRMSSYIPTPTAYNSKSKPFLLLTAEDRERDKVLEREKSREKLERETQYSKRWDDHLGFSITRGGKDKSKNKDRDNSKSFREDRNDTFIPTSREEAEQAGMKVICIKFRVQPTAAGEGDKAAGQDGAFPKTRRYTSTGPSLALVAGAGGMKVKMKTSTGPHVAIDSDVHIGEHPLEEFGGISASSSRSTTTAGTDSMTTSPTSHPTGFAWNLFGGNKVDDKERKTTERRKAANDDHGSLSPPSAVAGDFEAPTTVNSLGWKFVSPPRLEKGTGIRSTEFGGEVDEAGYAVTIPERSDSISPTLLTTARPTVVPILTTALATTTTAASSKSQPEHEALNEANDNSHSDSSSSISVSSPVFAHSPNESDLDDENFGPGGGAASALSGVNYKPRKGYRSGGYVQAQMKKAKNESGDERLVIGDRHGVAKAAEVESNSKLKDGGQPQQARREGKERNKNEERAWIALDMVNDNAFNSILRILHRHSPPYFSSSFTHSHTIINSPDIFNKAQLDLHHGSKDQGVPSDTDDDGQYAATAKNPATSDGTSHHQILGPLAAQVATAQQLAYMALPYPEWRLNLVNQARRAGIREIGRPLDLALHGWGREFEEAAARERKLQRELEREKQNRRKSEQSHVSTIKAKERRIGRVAGGSDADADDEDGDEQEAMSAPQLDSDSEEESDTEWLAWMTDLPRQFLVQQSQMAVQTSPTSQFSDPFSSSPLVEDDNEPIRPRTQEEERTIHADRIRNLEPSSIVRANPPYLPSPMFFGSLKQLTSHASYESLNQPGLSSRNSTPFPGLSSTDDLLVNKGNHSRSQSRSLQHLRHVASVPEEGGDGYNLTALSSSQKHGLHHSASVDQHLSSRRKEVDSHRRYDSISSNENQFALGKPILTNEQILQIESEVFTSATHTSLPLHWTFPPIPVPSPSPPPPPSSPSTSTSKARLPAVASTNTSGEVKNRFTPSDLTRWSASFGNPLSTPSSSSAPTNSASPPRTTSMLGSLGRSPSLLGKLGGQEKKGFLRKRMSRDLAKDREKEKDRDTGERAISPAGASPKQRPKLPLPGLSSSTSSYSPTSKSLPNHPEISTHNSNLSSGHQLHQSVSIISSSARALRRIHSGTSLRGEEGSTTPAAGLEVMSPPETEGREVQRKKKGPIDMIVRGFDSSLAFAEGR